MLAWIDRFNARFGDMIAWVYVLVFAITAYDVVMRYAFRAPTAWGAEIVIALCGMHYVLSGAMALQRGDHVRIDVIYNMLSPTLKRLANVVADVIIIAVVAAIVWYGAAQAAPSIRDWETTGTALNSPVPVFMKVAIPLAGALMLLQAWANLARNWRALVAGQGVDGSEDRAAQPPID
jgi:TRAP-type mannitol/chloroaromatic compound transport system permease small subunit